MKKLIMASITAVVVIVVMAGTLIPVLDDATATSDTFTNDGYFTLNKVTDTTSSVITWGVDDPKKITIDDEVVDMSAIGIGRSYTILGSDSVIVRYLDNGTSVFLQAFGSSYSSLIADSSNAGRDLAVTITISGGTITWEVSEAGVVESTYTKTHSIGTDCYEMNPNNTGDYVAIMKKANVPAYVNSDSKITFMGVSINDYSSGIALYGTGTIDDGITVSTVYKPNAVTAVTYSTPVGVYSEDSDHIDLYSLEKYQFSITRDSTTPVNVTYSYFIVPYEVTAERAVHFTDGENAIFGAIPVIVIVALLLGIVAMVIRSRMD